MQFRLVAAVMLVGAAWVPSAAAESFPGVTWTKPRLMITVENWTTHCPAQCIVYEGDEDRGEEAWPLVVVHSPVTGEPSAFYTRWAEAIERGDNETVSLIGNDVRALEDGASLHAYVAYTEAEGVTRGRDASMLFMYVSKGVIVPIEIKAFDKEDLAERTDDVTAILGSLKLDAAKASAALASDAADLAAKRAAIDKGFAAAGRVKLYMRSEIVIGTTFGLGGLEMTNDRSTTVYALLPGGVMLTALPDTFRKPDLERLKANGDVGSWSKTAAGYALVMPDGSRRSVGLNASGELVDGDESYPLVNPLTSRDLPGRYETLSVSTAGGMATGNATMIATRSDSSLDLGADGRFRQGRESYVSVSGPNIGGGVGNNDVVTGRWTFDPAAYMITLTPDDGTPAVSGLFFCYSCDAATVGDENWDWNVLGGEKWWRANKDG